MSIRSGFGEDPKSSNLAGEAKVLCRRERDWQMRGTELVPENVLPGILDAVVMIDGLLFPALLVRALQQETRINESTS